MTTLATEPGLAWYDDLCSCLQMDIGYVLQRQGFDPVQALGSGWRFRLPDGPVEPVEYFHPAGQRLQDQLCLHHPVRMRWHRPADAAGAHRDVTRSLDRGTPAIVAVNNFHLPFRPAYQDVHAAHLVVVTGWDEQRDSYQVFDPMPPAFAGEVPRAVLTRARAQINVDDDSDPFFAGSRPSWQWLEVRATGPQPAPDWAWLREVIQDNVAALLEPGQGPSALAELLRGLPHRWDQTGAGPLRELYVLGWPAQAEASLHATFLATAARRLDRPDLAEAARWVDLVAHAWTGLRVAAAHSRHHRADLDRVLELGRRLVLDWEHCVERLQRLTRAPR